MKHNITFAEVYTALVASGWPQWEAIGEALSRLDWLDQHDTSPEASKPRKNDSGATSGHSSN